MLDEAMELVEKVPGRRQIWHGLPDDGDGAGDRLREFVAIGCHHPCDTAYGRGLAWPFIRRGRSFFFSLPCRPFRDDTQTADETDGFHVPPKRGAVMATTSPGGLELCQERIKRTHPATEHIGAGTTHHLTDQPARLIRPPHDLFDRHAL